MDETLSADHRRKAGHYEIPGETYAKFEFFEREWNPYSRFLDVDKIDLILRKVISQRRVYREAQVKYGKTAAAREELVVRITARIAALLDTQSLHRSWTTTARG